VRQDDPIGNAAPDPRLEALQPYLARLAGMEADGPERDGDDRPARIRVGGRSLTLEPWERAQLRAASGHAGAGEKTSAGLVARALAILAKTLVDIERFARSDLTAESGFYELQAELMLDAAIGAELLGRTQRLVDERISAGRIDEAKRITELRRRLRRAMTEVHQVIVESERSLGRESGARPPEQRQAVAETLDHLSRRIEDRSRPQRRAEPLRNAGRDAAQEIVERLADVSPEPAATPSARSAARGALTILLGSTLLVLLGLRVISSVQPDPARRDLTHVLAAPGLDPFAVIDELRSRRPVLYVTVREIDWRALGEADRKEAVERVGREAAAHGYSGVLLRTAGRRPVARWLAAAGVRMIESREGGGAARSTHGARR
jgi:hypothetical protein